MNRNDYGLMDIYIGDAIRTARLAKGIALVDFAIQFKLTKQRYYNYEQGIRSLPLDLFVQMCKYLNIDPTQLYKDAQDHMRKELFKNADL